MIPLNDIKGDKYRNFDRAAKKKKKEGAHL